MKVVVFVSLIGYAYFNILGFESIGLPTFTNINGVEYYNGVIYFAIKSFNIYYNSGLGRNIGCFWEPGLFATFILFALVFEITFKKDISKTNLLLFLLGLLSTHSTFGYIMLIPIALIFLSYRISGFKLRLFSILTMLLLVVIALNYNNIVYYLYSWSPDLFGKLVNETASLTDRVEAPISNLKIFSKHLLFGAGFGNAEAVFGTLTDAAQTSTSTFFLAVFGFLGIMHSLFFVIGVLNYREINIYNRILILIMILVLINKEPHVFFTITFILMFYFLKQAVIFKNNYFENL